MQVELKYNIVKLVGGEWDFGETLSKADKTFSKSERFPSARGAWTGNLSPFTKDQASFRLPFPQIRHTTNQVDWSYTLVIIASENRYIYWLYENQLQSNLCWEKRGPV